MRLLSEFASQLRISYITSAPNGIRDNFAILKNCFPKGIPIIVRQHIRPATAFPIAIGIPDIISQIIFAIKLTAPPPYTTSFPNGKNAKPANLKHCKPIGIPIMEMHHRQPAKTHDNPLNKPPHINQSIFPNMLISIFLLFLFIYAASSLTPSLPNIRLVSNRRLLSISYNRSIYYLWVF